MNLVYKDTKNFGDKKVSTKQVIAILAKNNIKVDEEEATVILSFLYIVAKINDHIQREGICRNPLAEIEP